MTKLVNPDALAVTLTADPPLPAGYAFDSANVEIDFTKASAALGRFTTHRITASKPDSRTAEWVQTLGASIVPPGASSPPTLGSDITADIWTTSTGGAVPNGGGASPLVWTSPATQFGHVWATAAVTAGVTYLVSGVVTIGAVAPNLEFRIRIARGTSISTAGTTILASATIAAPQPSTAYDTGAATFTGLSEFTYLPGYGLLWTAPATETVALLVQQKNDPPYAAANFSIANAVNGGLRLRQYTPGAINRPRGPITFSGSGVYGGNPGAAYARDLLAEFENAEQVVPATMLPLWTTLDNGALTGSPPEGVYAFSLEARNEDTTLVVPITFSAPGLPTEEDAFWVTPPAVSPSGVPFYAGDPVRLVAGTPGGTGPFTITISGAGAPADFGVDVTPAVGDYVWTVTLVGASGVEATLDFAVSVQAKVEPPPPPGNLIVNGAFTTDLAGWTLTNTSTGALRPVWDAGRVRLQRVDFNDTAVLRQQIAVTANAAATLTVKLQAAAGTVYPRVYVGTSAGGSQVLAGAPTITTTQQTFTFNFTPTTSTIWLDIYPPGNGTTFYADDVTLTQTVNLLAGATWGDNGDENMRLTLAAPLPAGYTALARVWNAGTTEPTTALGLMTEGATRALWSYAQGFQYGGPTPRNGRVQIADGAGILAGEALFASEGSPGSWTTVSGAAGPGATVADIPAPTVVSPLATQVIASGGAISVDVSGVFSTGTAGLTVAGLPSGASYAAGTVSASAGAVADGAYTVALTASNRVAHNGAGGTATATLRLEVGDIIGEPEIIDPGPIASLADRSAGVSTSTVSGYQRLTVDGAQTEYGATTPVGVTKLAEYRLSMTVDTSGVTAGVPIHVRAARTRYAAGGDNESEAASDSAYFEHCVLGGTGVHVVQFWFMPTQETVHVGVRIARRFTALDASGNPIYLATPASDYVGVKDIRVDYAPPSLALGATGTLSEVRDRSVIFRFNQPATVRRSPTGHYMVVAAPGLTLVSTNWPSTATLNYRRATGNKLAHGLDVDRGVTDGQGYDERGIKNASLQAYQASWNVDPAVAGPLSLSSPKSLSKAVSFVWQMDEDGRVVVQQLVHLHVVPSLPSATAFPPTHFSATKATAYDTAAVDAGVLPSLAVPATAPRWEEAVLYALGSDYEHGSGNNPGHTNVFPRLPGGSYSRELRNHQSVLWMHLLGDKMPVEWKRRCALAMAYYGLHCADRRAAASSGQYVPKGANWGLRKPYAVLAATLLGDTGALATQAGRDFVGETMVQHVSQGRIDVAPTGAQSGAAYPQAQLGQPEFTQRPVTSLAPGWWDDSLAANETASNGGSNVNVTYRFTSGIDNIAWALAMRLLPGAAAMWGAAHVRTLDYLDRLAHMRAAYNGFNSNGDNNAPGVLEFFWAHRCRDAPASLQRWGLDYSGEFSAPALRTCRVGQAFSFDVRAQEFGAAFFTGGRVPTSFALRTTWSGAQSIGTIATALPAGLSLNASTGVISGTPTGTTGLLTFVVRGTHGASGTWADAVVKMQVTT